MLLGFLLSHLTPEQTERLFKVVRRGLHRDGVLAVVDSAWSEGKQAHRAKSGPTAPPAGFTGWIVGWLLQWRSTVASTCRDRDAQDPKGMPTWPTIS